MGAELPDGTACRSLASSAWAEFETSFAVCRDHFTADLHPEGTANPPSHAVQASSQEFNSLLLRRKLMYLAVESRLRFVRWSRDRGLDPPVYPAEELKEFQAESQLQQQKLRSRIGERGKEHRELYQELDDAHRSLAGLRDQCTKELRDTLRAKEVVKAAPLPVDPNDLLDWSATLREVVEQTVSSSHWVVAFGQGADAGGARKRRRVQHVKGCMEEEARHQESWRAYLERLSEVEAQKVSKLRLAAAIAYRLGLPRISRDLERKVVVASASQDGAPPWSCEVAFEENESKQVVCLMPPASLRLWTEAAYSLERNDFGRLLTLVCERVKDTSAQPGRA